MKAKIIYLASLLLGIAIVATIVNLTENVFDMGLDQQTKR